MFALSNFLIVVFAGLLLIVLLVLPITRLLLGVAVFFFVILTGIFTIAAFLIPF
jgi:hypothetical protein